MDSRQTDIEQRVYEVACAQAEEQLAQVFDVLVRIGNPRELEPMERCAVLKAAVADIRRICSP